MKSKSNNKVYRAHVCYVTSFLSILYPLISSAQGHGTVDGNEKWGYVTVRPKAHMFYWLYKSYHADDYKTRPLVLWLQVGNLKREY